MTTHGVWKGEDDPKENDRHNGLQVDIYIGLEKVKFVNIFKSYIIFYSCLTFLVLFIYTYVLQVF